MIRHTIGIALGVILALGYAVSEVFMTDDQAGQDSHHQQAIQGLDNMLLADSGDNIWVNPEPWQRSGQPPAYLADPHYVTPEDLERDMLKQGQKPGRNTMQQPRQRAPGGEGVQQSVPYMPYGYGPLPGTPYGNLPGFSTYPGMGSRPGYGMPYYGQTPGFGGNPLMTPYGSGYQYQYGSPPEQSMPRSED